MFVPRRDAREYATQEAKPWMGKHSRLIISVDVGASQTAVVVAYLKPGFPPHVQSISRWPGQERNPSIERIPTIAYYDGTGHLMACGAQASLRKTEILAQRNGWHFLSDFKLHLTQLHPNGGIDFDPDLVFRDLPPFVELAQVYANFMSYLLAHTRRFLVETVGHDIWDDLKDTVQVVLAHPSNPAATSQRLFLFDAAVRSGLITEEHGKEQMKFMEEAEAATRYCVSTKTDSLLRISQFAKGDKIIVCDAGGSTADIGVYQIASLDSERIALRELELPHCLAAGGGRVKDAFASLLREKLSRAIGEKALMFPVLLADGVKDFEEGAKRTFRSVAETYDVELNSRTLSYPDLGIHDGTLSVDGSDMQKCFESPVRLIVDNLRRRKCVHPDVKFVILTGGFGESPYLQEQVRNALGPGCIVVIANSTNSKAVAMGALMHMVGSGVRVQRVSKGRTSRKWATGLLAVARNLVRR